MFGSKGSREKVLPVLLAVGIAGLVHGADARADTKDKGLSAGELDKIQKAFPHTPVPKEFRKPSKGPHGSGDPHAQLGPEKLVTVALQHLSEGRRKEAMITLDSGIAKYPESTKLRGIRGSIHLQHQDYTKALSDFEAAIAVDPDDVLILVNRAQAYRSFDRMDEAMADLDKAVKLQPDMVAARFNRGSLYVTRGELEKARADFEHSISVDPHAAAPRFNLAITLDGLGKREDAIVEMERFLQVAKVDSWKKVAEEQLAAWKKPDTTETAKSEQPAKTEGGDAPKSK